MITNIQEIDLDSFFGPDAHVPTSDLLPNSFVNDIDIDQAINNALAEIDETSNNIHSKQQSSSSSSSSTPYHPQKTLIKLEYSQSPTPYLHTPSHSFNGIQHEQQPSTTTTTTTTTDTPTMHYPKPCESTMKPLSPASLLSDDSRSPQTPSVSEYEMTKLRGLYEQKCKDLDIAIIELKRSEKKRFVIMKENKQLKEMVSKLTMEF